MSACQEPNEKQAVPAATPVAAAAGALANPGRSLPAARGWPRGRRVGSFAGSRLDSFSLLFWAQECRGSSVPPAEQRGDSPVTSPGMAKPRVSQQQESVWPCD